MTIREYEVGGCSGAGASGVRDRGGGMTGIIDIDWCNGRRISGWMSWVIGFVPCLL